MIQMAIQIECLHETKYLRVTGVIKMLFRHRRPCSTRYKSMIEIQYPTLAIDPRRYLKYMSPQTFPLTTQPFTQSGYTAKLLP